MVRDELTVWEAAAALGISMHALRERARRGQIPTRVARGGPSGRYLLFARTEVERWQQAHRMTGERPASRLTQVLRCASLVPDAPLTPSPPRPPTSRGGPR